MEDTGLLKLTHRLVTDEEYRKWFMASPKQALMDDLGISAGVYDSLVAALPLLLAGALFAAGGGDEVDPLAAGMDWGTT